jgi:hypothetical protein
MSRSSSESTIQTLNQLARHAIAFGRANTGTPSDADQNPKTKGYQGLPLRQLAGAAPAVLRKGHVVCVYFDDQHVLLSDPARDQVIISDGPCPFGHFPIPRSR